MSKYYTREDLDKLRFYQVPKVLLEREKYRQLGLAEKLVYGILLDRTFLSIKNNWFDENGYAYILFSGETLGDVTNVHEKTARRYIRNLKNFGLLNEKRMGKGLANRIYLSQPEYINSDVIEFNDYKRKFTEEDLQDFIKSWRKNVNVDVIINDNLKKKLESLFSKYGRSYMLNSIEEIKKSNYLMGKVNGLVVTLDWFLKEENLEKVSAGRYKNIIGKTNGFKNKFHNFTQRSDKYSEEQIEDIVRRKRQQFIDSLKADSL